MLFRFASALDGYQPDRGQCIQAVTEAATAIGVRFDLRDVTVQRNGTVLVRGGLKLGDRATLHLPRQAALPYQRRGVHADRRRLAAVCWHGHRDFFRALYADLPAGLTCRITTGLATYTDAAQFEQTYKASDRNIGSRAWPVMASRACECGHEIAFGTLTAQGEYIEARMIRQSDIQRCSHVILVPAHYRADGSCRCDDPGHREMREWGYVWDRLTHLWTAPTEEASHA